MFKCCYKHVEVFTRFKELKSRAKHGQCFKKRFEGITVFLYQIHTFRIVSESFFRSWLFLTSWRVELLIWAFLPEECARARINRSESKRESKRSSMRFIWQRCTDSLRKYVFKEVCFCLWGKDNLVQLPEEPSVTWTVDAVCFFGAATEFLKRVCWWTFYKPGPVRRWICTWFDTERWSGPSYERSRSWFRTSDDKWNCIKRGFCWRLEQMLVTL